MKSKLLKQLTVDCCDNEKSYRRKLFEDVATVLNYRLFCTCCLRDVKNDVLIKDKVYIHPFFQVLVCKECLKFYGDGYISADEDGSDKYCRWCGQGGCLNICSECPVAICKSCVRRNMNRSVRKDVERDDWKCFSCNPEPLYDLRAQAWALKSWLKSKKHPKKVVKEESNVNVNTVEGQLKNGLDYEIGLIKEIQKVCRSSEMKLGGISRRKDLVNKTQLSFDKINNVSKEIISQIETAVDKLNQFKDDIADYFKQLATVIEKLEKENVNNNTESIEISDNDEEPVNTNKKTEQRSSDKQESTAKKQKSGKSDKVAPRETLTSNISKDLSDKEDSNGSSVKKGESNSNGLANGECEAADNLSETDVQSSKDTDDNSSLYETVAPEIKDKDENFPKLTLRIRKVDEVNRALENHQASPAHNPPEVINLEQENPAPLKHSQEIDTQEKNPIKQSEPLKSPSDDEDINQDEPELEGEESNESTNKDDIGSKNRHNEAPKKDVKPKTSSSTKNESEELNKKCERIKSTEEREKASSSSPKKKQSKETSSKMDVNESGDIFSEEEETVVTCVVSSTTSDSSETEYQKAQDRKQVRKSRGARNSSMKNKNLDDLSDADSDIEKLLNTKSLSNKKRKLEIKPEKEDQVKDEKEEKRKSSTNRDKEKTILDYCDEESDDSVIDLHAELNAQVNLEPLDKDSLWKMLQMDILRSLNRQSLTPELSEAEEACGSDNSEDLLLDSDDERKSKKKHKMKEEGEQENSENDKDSDDSQTGKNSKSAKWKSDKLLTMKLSDDSDSDDIFQKPTDNKNEKRNKKKVKVLSDSEAEDQDEKNKKNSSESSDSDISNDETPKKKRRRIMNATSSSDDDNAVEGSGGKGRKNIRKVLKKDSLQESTQNALKEEEERKKRITERQKLYNQLMEECEIMSSKVDKLVLDFDVESKKELLSVDKDLVEKLKPHQAEGIKFMWDSCFETVKKAKKSKGSGCILAHCMGLGKTLQVVTLLHTLLTNDVGIKCALVLCPLSTVLNWVNEFEKWLSAVGSGQDVDVFHMTKINAQYRASQLRQWQKQGGVMVLAYNLFRVLVNPTKRVKPSLRTAYMETLTDPGPDIVVCDEGHLLKNEKTALSKAVEKFKTLRRIVLTGTPLQNNLIEYHCMMQFVKPNLLGTKKEFINRFVNPIENGQFVDSTPHDVKVMKRRAHVLHKMLDGLVQRKAYNVLVPFLPTKFEYVLSLSLTDVQVKLYQHYLDNLARNKSGNGAGTSLFKDRNMLSLICAHPRLLMVHDENELMKKDFEESDEEGSLKDFIHDSSSESSSSAESSSDNSDSSASVKMVSKRRTRSAPAEEKNLVEEDDTARHENWWSSIVQDGEMEDIGASSKLMLLFTILRKCEEIGDKLLVFSQSLLVLDLIEYFLDKIDNESQSDKLPPGLRGFASSWCKGIDYFRLDGKTTSENRANWCNRFNNESNLRSRLFLISTRAGGLGINLTGANRVILFDASWNPSHDVQSIFRVYRFGQSKPCYIYRFLNKGTMEQKVYDRQVAKLSMSCRVIDEQQIDRHFSYADLNELYTFNPNEKDDKTLPLPKDRMLAEMLQEHKDLVLWYHSHDSLLENQENEELNEEERKQAWADFENEKNPPANEMMNNFAETYQKVYSTLKMKYPLWSDADVRQAVHTVLSKMNTMAGVNNTSQLHQQQFAQQQYMLMQQQINRNQFQMQPRLQSVPPRLFNNQVYNKNNYQGLPVINNPLFNARMSAGNNMFNSMHPPNTLTNPYAMSQSLPNPYNQNAQSMLQGNPKGLNHAGGSQQSRPGTSAEQ